MSGQVRLAEVAVDLAKLQRFYESAAVDHVPTAPHRDEGKRRARYEATSECSRLARELVKAHAILEAAHREVIR